MSIKLWLPLLTATVTALGLIIPSVLSGSEPKNDPGTPGPAVTTQPPVEPNTGLAKQRTAVYTRFMTVAESSYDADAPDEVALKEAHTAVLAIAGEEVGARATELYEFVMGNHSGSGSPAEFKALRDAFIAAMRLE